jgi:hypothetical protein
MIVSHDPLPHTILSLLSGQNYDTGPSPLQSSGMALYVKQSLRDEIKDDGKLMVEVRADQVLLPLIHKGKIFYYESLETFPSSQLQTTAPLSFQGAIVCRCVDTSGPVGGII